MLTRARFWVAVAVALCRRSDASLSTLRSGEMRLELLEREGAPEWPRVEMRDAEGRLYECAQRAKPPQTEKNTTTTVAKQGDSLAHRLDSLDGVCVVHTAGWWNYEWCHRKSVRQYHEAAGTRHPEWSLGGYSRTEFTKSDDQVPSTVGGGVVDVFEKNGQRCDETDRGRSTRVSFRCCDPNQRNRPWSAKNNKKQRAHIVSVVEAQVCEYALIVCTPSLCENTLKEDATVTELLGTLHGVCLQRHEGWWSFEFCFMSRARQFHVENFESEGTRGTRVATEFSLGRSTTGDLKLEPGEVPHVDVELAGGTECDVTDGELSRGTTARFVCGDGNMLVSVVEDSTCHYVFTVATPVLCKHAAFRTTEIESRTVECNAPVS